ncbi:MAG: N-6 DNA methylase [Treponema sp.]|nr:N-6 DNA methylase [Treponema sp.]
MLESETKRRIDSARDILVGKVPDPKSQVEQITIALIYKFMDDMDRESIEMGGKASFFSGGNKRYSWSHIFDPRLGGHEMLNLYAEAIVKLNQNAAIPQLFRDIFKNAYLPYRDPETLKLFLAMINEFTYDHSENLGDAFEYLLSVLGSQGDAGQFRTPRNIIDFMVEVIDPQKNETIIDPACGTAGFLISSYKHIIKANTKKTPGDLLTTAERKKLMGNFRGYDISPDMVRLSLVNLYLHGFSQPKIFEYDTLTSDERWNEYADIILANPPFMSPKGGIKPHKRFSVQSSRSEVLFVDYIAEHLTPSGRAAVIVPEGIIFQSGTAYKQLRKILVEKYLYAVASLPAGVFNPYSGVKTSILFLDPHLARKSDSILFVKIENDGFSLGAQRRAIDSNDLPEAVKIIGEFRKKVSRRRAETQRIEESKVSNLVVAKEKIAANGEYYLSGERYREVDRRNKQKWPMVRLEEVCDVRDGTHDSPKYVLEGYPLITSKNLKNGFIDFLDANLISREDLDAINKRSRVDNGDILMPMIGTIGNPIIADISQEYAVKNVAIIKFYNDSKICNHFLKNVLASVEMQARFERQASGSTQKFIPLGFIRTLKIPLPPIEIQLEIVTKIEGYQKIIDGARLVVDNWKPHIEVDPDWPMVPVGDIVEFVSGLTVSIPEVETDGGIPIISINNVTEEGSLTLKGLRFIKPPTKKLNYLQKGDLLFNWRNGSKHLVGKTAMFNLEGKYLFASFLLGIRPDPQRIENAYLWNILNTYRREGRYEQFMRQNVNGLFNREELKIVEIPLPPIEVQRAIVAEIEKEQALVAANRELIALYEEKIRRVAEGVWGE